MSKDLFHRTVMIPSEPEEDLSPIWQDKWFLSQLTAMAVSFLALFGIFWGLEAFSAPMPITRILRAEVVEEQLTRYLQQQLPKDASFEVIVQRHSQIPFLDIPDGEVRWHWKGPKLMSNGPRSMYTAELSHQKGWRSRVGVNVSVRLKTNVFIAKKTIPNRTQVQTDDFEVVRTEVLPTLYADLMTGTLPKDRRSRGVIPVGAMLSRHQLEELPAVRRGAQVQVLYREGALTVKTLGWAQTDGRKGEAIRVHAGPEKRNLEAVVLDAGVVEVRL